MSLGSSSGIAFTWLSNFAATSALVTWFGIGVTYLRFYEGMKAKGIKRQDLPFTSRLQPFAGWWCVCGSAFVLLLGAWPAFLKGHWSTPIFVTQYLPVVLFPVLYISAKLVMEVDTKSAEEIDLVSNVREFEEMTFNDPPPRNSLEAIWMWLV